MVLIIGEKDLHHKTFRKNTIKELASNTLAH